jgi:hypothetical protein
MRQPKPITISPDLAVRCDRPDAAERMDQLFRAVISVPHSVVVKEEEKWKQARGKHKS